MSSTIKQPKPTSRISTSNINSGLNQGGSGSNRLLSPHLSVLEALQSTSQNDEIQSPSPKQSAGSTPNILNSYEFTSQASWHSIAGNYMAPRPTSSVLSSSDIEENYQDDPVVEYPSSTLKRQHESSQSTATVQGNPSGRFANDEDDDKTIEINLNDQGNNNNIDASKFVLPTMYESYQSQLNQNQDSKILIIGHKKHIFLQSLNDDELQDKFTLNYKSNYKIILIIFDGLIKIGNILNFLKVNQSKLQDKLFIPIFKNINIQIITKLLKNYNINLLCSPINLNDHIGVANLFNILKEDFLLQKSQLGSSYLPLSPHDEINDDQNRLFAIEQSINSYQLIRIASDSSVDYDYDYDQDLVSGRDTRQKALSINRHDSSSSSSNKKIVLLQNQPYEIIHHASRSSSHWEKNHNKKSKKLIKRDERYRKFVFLAISLTIGIGIGVTTALTITFSRSGMNNDISISKKDSNLVRLDKLSKIAKNQFQLGNTLMKKNLIVFKQHVTSITKGIVDSSHGVINKLGDYWKSFMISSHQGVQTGLIWFI